MIGRIEFLFAILVPMILEGMVILYTRRKNRNTLPPGSYLVESISDSTKEKAPGTTWNRYGGLIGHWIGDLSIFGVVLIYILSYIFPLADLYRSISPLTSIYHWL